MNDTVASYRLLEPSGHGPLGETYRARDTARGRTVTLTLVDPSIVAEPATRARLLKAAKAASELSHPHIAALWEAGEEKGRVFIASEFVSGSSLRTLARGKPFEPGRAVAIAIRIADALAEAWARQIVHRDLRPETVFVTSRDQVKIVGFGLADWNAPPTTTPFHSPEQVLGETVDHRCDIFALGVLLYEMLTGRVPFAARTPDDTAVKILQATPPLPSTVAPAVGPELDAIVMRALSKSLDGRYQVAATMAAELRALAAVLEHRVEHGEALRRGRKRMGRLAVAVAGILLVAMAAVPIWHYRVVVWPPTPQRALPSAPPPPTLLVFPFDPPAGDASRAFLAAGVSSDLVVRLARMPGVRVLGRAASRSRGRSETALLARQVGAAAALWGSVSGDPGTLRVDVTLVRAGTGERIWSGTFAEGPAGPLVLLEQIVDATLGRLAPVAAARAPGQRARRTDEGAYALYLQGREAAERRDRARAVTLFEQAIARDGALAEAHAALAEALYLEAFYGGAGIGPETGRRAAEAAARAVATDPEYPPAQMARGLTAPTLAEALDALIKAVALDPSYAEAWHQIGDQIIEIDPGRALAFYAESLRLDPGLDASYRDMASAHQQAARPAEASRAVQAGRQARADRPWWTQLDARFALERGAWDEAMALLAGERSTESVPAVWLAGAVSPLALTGRPGEALQAAARLVERHPWSCEGRVAWLGLLLEAGNRHDRDRARRELGAIVTSGTGATSDAEARICGAAAAAALSDPRRSAALISAVASDEASLRLWLREVTFSTNLAFRHSWYPWNRVAARPEMKAAAERLDYRVARLRLVVAGRLASVQARLVSAPPAQPALDPPPAARGVSSGL